MTILELMDHQVLPMLQDQLELLDSQGSMVQLDLLLPQELMYFVFMAIFSHFYTKLHRYFMTRVISCDVYNFDIYVFTTGAPSINDPTGATGAPCLTGSTGPMVPFGSAGAPGANGTDGTQCANGARGATDAQGPYESTRLRGSAGNYGTV